MKKLTAAGFVPAPNRIFCRTMEPEKKEGMEKNASGIWVNKESDGQSRDPKELCEVVSVGSEIKTKLSPGDIIYNIPFGGQKFTLEGVEYILITEGEILGVFKS